MLLRLGLTVAHCTAGELLELDLNPLQVVLHALLHTLLGLQDKQTGRQADRLIRA